LATHSGQLLVLASWVISYIRVSSHARLSLELASSAPCHTQALSWTNRTPLFFPAQQRHGHLAAEIHEFFSALEWSSHGGGLVTPTFSPHSPTRVKASIRSQHRVVSRAATRDPDTLATATSPTFNREAFTFALLCVRAVGIIGSASAVGKRRGGDDAGRDGGQQSVGDGNGVNGRGTTPGGLGASTTASASSRGRSPLRPQRMPGGSCGSTFGGGGGGGGHNDDDGSSGGAGGEEQVACLRRAAESVAALIGCTEREFGFDTVRAHAALELDAAVGAFRRASVAAGGVPALGRGTSSIGAKGGAFYAHLTYAFRLAHPDNEEVNGGGVTRRLEDASMDPSVPLDAAAKCVTPHTADRERVSLSETDHHSCVRASPRLHPTLLIYHLRAGHFTTAAQPFLNRWPRNTATSQLQLTFLACRFRVPGVCSTR
jgi:hypothetical protein